MKKSGKKINLSAVIVISMFLGVLAGFIGGKGIQSIKFLGDIFFRLIQMSIIPMVMLQIIEAVGSLERKRLGTTGIRALAAFLISSLLASAFGIFMACQFKPGKALDGSTLALSGAKTQAVKTTFQGTLTAFVPSNIVKAMADGSMIQVILFALFFGVVLSAYRERHEVCRVYDLVRELNEMLLGIIRIAMYAAPVGIFAYVAATVGVMGSSSIILLLKYLLVFGGAVAIFMAAWISVVAAYARMNVITLLRKMAPMSFMALATTSSAVTLPLEMEDAKNKIGIGSGVANLVLPLGMPLNSNGAAMHMALTSVTIAQMYSIHFSFKDLAYVAVISMLLSLANAVVPGAALVSLTMIVPQLGLPVESIAIFAGVDWIVGMYRTILNVDSDVFCAILVARSERSIDYEVFNSIEKKRL